MLLKTNGFFFLELIFFQIIFRRGFNYIGRFYTNLFASVRVLSPPPRHCLCRRSKEINAVPEMPSVHAPYAADGYCTRVCRQVCRYVRRLPLRKDRLDQCVTFIILMTGT